MRRNFMQKYINIIQLYYTSKDMYIYRERDLAKTLELNPGRNEFLIFLLVLYNLYNGKKICRTDYNYHAQ